MSISRWLLVSFVAWTAGCDTAAVPADASDAFVPAPDADAVCEDDSECSDGLFCNGAETCRPGTAGADSRGCLSGAPPCPEDETCDELAARCDVPCEVELDADGDGHDNLLCGGDDCDDDDANRFPGNVEVCDGEEHDEDCNPETFGFLDADGDGSASSACCNGIVCGEDCNDADSTVNPRAGDGPPLLCDGVDNDCSGTADDGCPCVEGETQPCGTPAQVSRIGLCRPGTQVCAGGAFTSMCIGGVAEAEERCDGEDNDCDASTDEGVQRTYFRDADGDGWGVSSETLEACSPPAGWSASDGDCDDARASVSPSGTEVCNGRDDDCDLDVDEGLLVTYFRDSDGDGYGDPAMSMQGCSAPSGYVANGTDCDDTSRSVSPAAPEVCNGQDDDCDGTMDPGCSCTDGMTRPCGPSSATGRCVIGTQRCIAGGWAECVGAVLPGAETCNGVDDDCDGTTDEGVTTTYYRDSDGDGFGASSMTTQSCSVPTGYSALSTDCNDGNAAVNPAATERCNGVDDNCTGGTDEGCECTDGATRACGAADGSGGILETGECTAGEQSCLFGHWGGCVGSVEPTVEVCNGRDDDCDGSADESLTASPCYADGDGDGYGTGASFTHCRDASRGSFGYCPSGWTNAAGDCNDSAASIRPGAAETCNGLDDDCDGSPDETFACVLGRAEVCSTSCGTSGSRICSASCTLPACTAPIESCNYCDDDGDGTFVDERYFATPSISTQLTCGNLTRAGTASGAFGSSCTTTGLFSGYVLVDSTNEAGAVWLQHPLEMGHDGLALHPRIAAQTSSTLPSDGWAIVIATDPPGARVGSPGNYRGIPFTRRGLSVEWLFYSTSGADSPDSVAARTLTGSGTGTLRGWVNVSASSSLDGMVPGTSREQELYIYYMPSAPAAGLSQRLVVATIPQSDPRSPEGGVLLDRTDIVDIAPGSPVWVGVTASTTASNSSLVQLRADPSEPTMVTSVEQRGVCDAGVPDGSLRLVSTYADDWKRGRLEVFHAGLWGTVCDDPSSGSGWDSLARNAGVACRQLGYASGVAWGASSTPDGVGLTWMDEVVCAGSETRLDACTFPGWGVENCGHSEDVGVSCTP